MKWLLCLLCASLHATIEIQLNESEYSQGVLTTKSGGFIRSDEIRIQADEIEYDKTLGIVHAGKNIAILWHGCLIIAKKLTYDFQHHSGVLEEAAAAIQGWIVRGETIKLFPNQTLAVYKASVSTCQEGTPLWDLFAEEIFIESEGRLATKAIQARVQTFPIFLIPAFRMNLKKFQGSTVRYWLTWDTGQGPRFTMRYRLYSWETGNLYGRFDYQWFHGPGVAIEVDNHTDRSLFHSFNYYAYDTFFNATNPEQRLQLYRLQGLYKSHDVAERTYVHLQYDKFDNKNMPLTFKASGFEYGTALHNELTISHLWDHSYVQALCRPRLNPFDSLKEQIPALDFFLFPVPIASSGLYLDGGLKASFLDFLYSNDLNDRLKNFQSARGEVYANLARPFSIKGVKCYPYGNVREILYSRDVLYRSATQNIVGYGLWLSQLYYRQYPTVLHTLTPYAHFDGLSQPSHNEEEIYIFDLHDGWHQLNQLRLGLKQNFFFHTLQTPAIDADLYTIAFFGNTPFPSPFQKIGATVQWDTPSLSFSADARWFVQPNSFDWANGRIAWTLSENAAFSLELRHRSKYAWRKEDMSSFILDVARTNDEMLNTPLSDGRDTLLARIQIRPLPEWTVRVALHSGWGRGAREMGYIEGKVDLITMLTSSWRLTLGYVRYVNAQEFNCRITLVER